MCDQLRKIWTTSLGFILAVLMLGLNVSHAVDSHIELDHHHEHCDNSSGSNASSDPSDADQQALPSVANLDVAAPAVSDFVSGSPALLRLSFGIDGEEIDPPRV